MKLERQEGVSETLPQPGEARLPRWQGRGGRRDTAAPGPVYWRCTTRSWVLGDLRALAADHSAPSHAVIPSPPAPRHPGLAASRVSCCRVSGSVPVTARSGTRGAPQADPCRGEGRRLVPPPCAAACPAPLAARRFSPSPAQPGRAGRAAGARAGPAPWASPGTRPVPAGCAEPPRGPPGSVQPSRAA